MSGQTAIEAFVEVLAAAGVRHLFGNPGSMEYPLVDALARQAQVRYVLGLHEVTVLGMADGYAQAGGRLGVVNVHCSPGLGNSMGMLYNAWRAGTPLLVTAGQQDRRLLVEEPVLWSDLARVAEPYTKLSLEVQRAADLPRVLRRAVQAALTPPTGPVFLALPYDLQTEAGAYDGAPPVVPDHHVRPARAAVAAAAALLLAAERPALLAGSRAAVAEATGPLVALAEALGAAVYTEPVTTHGRMSMPSDHALACGALPLFAPEIRTVLERHDVLLAVGADVIGQYYHRDAPPLPAGVCLLHLDQNAREIGKIYPPAVALVGDPTAGLTDLMAAVAADQTPAQRTAAAARGRALGAANDARRAAARAEAAAERARQPLTALGLMHVLAEVMPANAVIVDEAVTSSRLDFERFGWLRDPLAYYGHRGWGLGWGVGVALGAALALPGRPVVGLLGEGSLLYGAQGLWTAAKEQLPVVYVVCNNASYAILKAGMIAGRYPSALAGQFIGMDLTGPEIDVPGLARALGVTACRVDTAGAVADAVAEAIRTGQPTLLDVPIDRTLGADRR